jgi:hypothetical protein
MEQDIEPKHPGGRPSKRTPEITEQICEAISYGLTDEEVAAKVGIDDSTLTCWKKIPEFSGAIKKAVATRKLARLKRIRIWRTRLVGDGLGDGAAVSKRV